ncbi:MAG: flavin reductase family protein [Isosphaeraceae bacterium]
MTTESHRTPLGHALGRIPSGLYILSVRSGGTATGMLASWVQQAGFDPPMVTVAVARQRFVADWITASGRFTLSQLAQGSKPLLRHFAKGFGPNEPAFDGVPLREDSTAEGGPVLADALGFLDAEVVGEVGSGDHRVFLGRVVAGRVFDSAPEPFVHLRGNGFHY